MTERRVFPTGHRSAQPGKDNSYVLLHVSRAEALTTPCSELPFHECCRLNTGQAVSPSRAEGSLLSNTVKTSRCRTKVGQVCFESTLSGQGFLSSGLLSCNTTHCTRRRQQALLTLPCGHREPPKKTMTRWLLPMP